MDEKRICMLMILDGWGISARREGNAVFLAGTPGLNKLMQAFPHTHLRCSGEAVGLPEGIMGNSEVGHLNIGAGRIVFQDLLRIDMAIKKGIFFENRILKTAISKVKANQSALHLIGLVSDGGVHSHLGHISALLEMASNLEVNRVFVHAILDGRDTAPDSGVEFIKTLQDDMEAKRIGRIATICGRYYAMDRDNRWDRTEKAFRLFSRGEGFPEKEPVQAVKNAYDRNETDEFVQPIFIMAEDKKPVAIVQDGDGIIFFNFRADRVRQITRALTDPTFDSFQRNPFPRLSQYVCMTRYDEKFTLPVAFPPGHLDQILGAVISKQGLKQLRIAETEKYAHVTYFFNGGEEKPFLLEDRCLIPSPRDIPTYDHKPEMSAIQVTEEVVARIKSNKYDLIVLNFANMDMVGHTGVLEAAVKACQTVDNCVKKIVAEIRARNGAVLITADHGNAEKMTEENGHVHTAHTLNPVPFLLVDDTRKRIHLKPGILADIAPTILEIMAIKKPKQMTGSSLLTL
jgi:2,3-bisphosphoglycerate-independent phosphoglycerate mutase